MPRIPAQRLRKRSVGSSRRSGLCRKKGSGELAALISLANQHPRSSGTRVPVTLVAGARNHREFPICVAL